MGWIGALILCKQVWGNSLHHDYQQENTKMNLGVSILMVTESGCPRLNQNFQQDRSFIVMLWGQFVQWLSRPATLFDVTI